MMTDSTQELLLQHMRDTHIDSASRLFMADENVSQDVIAKVANMMPVITNRAQLFNCIKHLGANHQFSDFDCSHIAMNSLDQIYYRTSKEKAVVHYIINLAARLLKPEGRLILAGEKQQGIQTYINKSAQVLGCMAEVKKDGPARIGVLHKLTVGELLDDSDYANLRPVVAIGSHTLFSKPGVYGWDKLDQGSEFLASQLHTLAIKNKKVLDLGCGYGYLSAMAQALAPASIDATDNNAAAIVACSRNFVLCEINGKVSADDIGSQLTPGYDVIVCNPPFHLGFEIERNLSDRFLAASARLLARTGQAIFVINSFIPLEKIAASYFEKVAVIADNKRYKVILLEKSRKR